MNDDKPLIWLGGEVKTPPFVDRNATWRLIYYTDVDVVAILEVFSKKTRATPRRVIDTCRKRLAQYKDIMRG